MSTDALIAHEDATRFLEANGKPLTEFGSSEYGLSRSDSLLFIDLVRQNNLNIVGVEIWRQEGDGYNIESLMTWYAIEADVIRNLEEVQEFIGTVSLSDGDLLTIQYADAGP